MIISLGSKSEDKKNIVLHTLRSENIDAEVLGYSVESGITDQPLDEEITIKGAKNRAKAALAHHPGSQIGLGLEGGLVEIDNKGYFLVCVAAIFTPQGQEYIGISSKLQLPIEVSEQIKQGNQFGQIIRDFEEKHLPQQSLKIIIDELISRKLSFGEAIRNAFLPYLNSVHFTK